MRWRRVAAPVTSIALALGATAIASPALGQPDQPLAFRIGAAVWGDGFAEHRISLGFTLDAGIRYRWFSAAIEARGDPPIGVTWDPNAANLGRFTGALLVCGHPAAPAEWVVLCLKGEAGAALFPTPLPDGTTQKLYSAGGLRFGLEIPVAPPQLLLRVLGDLQAPFVGLAPVGNDKGTVFEFAKFNGGLGVGLVYVIDKS
jgi:hypothetical protein